MMVLEIKCNLLYRNLNNATDPLRRPLRLVGDEASSESEASKWSLYVVRCSCPEHSRRISLAKLVDKKQTWIVKK